MRLHEHDVADRQHLVLPGAAGEGPGLLVALERRLRAARFPGVAVAIESVWSGGVRGLFARHRRPFLVVRHGRLEVLIGYQDHGTALTVTRYIVLEPTFRDFWHAVRNRRGPVDAVIGDPFQDERVAALLAVVDDALRAVLRAVVRDQQAGDDEDDDLLADLDDESS